MNTELSPEITRTCSNTRGKIGSYNNSGKSSYANFEIGPDLNKPYVQFVKHQVKMHQDDLHEILVKLHIKFIRLGATA